MKNLSLSPNIIWPLVVLAIAFGAFYLKPWQQKPTETISVSSEGKTQVVPNIAKITAAIESQNHNLDQARKNNQERVDRIVNLLKEQGVEEKDIKTEFISAGPNPDIYSPSIRQTLNRVITSLEITIRDFRKADQIIALLTANGTTNLYGPNLTIDDQTLEKAKSEARQKAVENAKQKAAELAQASGRKIGKVTSIKDGGDFRIPQPLMAQGAADLEQKASQIQPGQNDVSINLQVEFSLR